jgi:hypothetical protein
MSDIALKSRQEVAVAHTLGSTKLQLCYRNEIMDPDRDIAYRPDLRISTFDERTNRVASEVEDYKTFIRLGGIVH